ncbi:hypothetical protein H6P81_016346 [Aristolochia fimbriata]|uniref:Serine/threonine-protein kinase 11-interacting protein n=1 Tax=Aristolochia fimbriata TaxID=158543 RepID=A0AAV7EB45_ARIFI|nr:hypothetical protein H6P81_016346 [Aristolochia fimbriata]
MAIVTGDRYLDQLVKFVEKHAGSLIEGTLVLKLNPVGLHYVQTRLEQLQEVEGLLAGAPVDYLRAYISDLGDHRALEQLRRILRLLTSLKVVSIFPQPARDPTPLSLLPFSRLKVLELRGCDLSTSAARGLLDLRHTLEKFICYNSTDALRHIFASRIIDIKASPVWNKLTFVSCTCNGIVPMDESLQLLPAVETLDLSRNSFAKVDNLRKCTKLTHLDLGFNHLRTIASLSEVSCPIVKLVLRNNALTTLRCIENLKSVEGLDLSYNIISTFSEMELLSGLPSLKSLWLEGNPICCARWYRAHVFSFFAHPDTLKLDERVISKRESWKRLIILASRNKRPPGYGFYSPAKERGEVDSSCNMKRKKQSRLACIEDDELRRHFISEQADHESTSCDGEILKREDSIMSEGEEEILGLINRVELMKKEQSVHWLRDFREWMDQSSNVMIRNNSLHGGFVGPSGGKSIKMQKNNKHLGERMKHAQELVQDSGDETSTNPIDSETSFTDTYVSFHSQEFSSSDKRSGSGPSMIHNSHKVKPLESLYFEKPSSSKSSNLEEGDTTDSAIHFTSLKAIDEIMVSRMPSLLPSSPPHYEEDILHRRQGLEEEFMQLSAESFSVVSLDSDTSCCEDNLSNLSESYPKFYHLSDEDSGEGSVVDQLDAILDEDYYDTGSEAESESLSSSHGETNLKPATSSLVGAMDQKTCDTMSVDEHFFKKRKKKQKPKQRMISLSEESTMVKGKDFAFPKLNGILHADKVKEQDELDPSCFDRNDIHSSQDIDKAPLECLGSSTPECKLFTKNYFDQKIADHEALEICLHCMHCRCMFQRSGLEDMEVFTVQSSEKKVYTLVLDKEDGGTGHVLTLLGCHRLQDIKSISVGMGLHVLRVHVEDNQYLFIMRTVEEARELFLVLGINDLLETDYRCSLTSWEQVQVNLFNEEICGGLRMGIYLYSMILFWHETSGGDWWLSRSLFVVEGYVLVCIEDVVQLSTIANEAHVSSPYYTLDSCCPIHKISEMVVEIKGHKCVTLTMDEIVPEDIHIFTKGMHPQENALGLATWKVKWYSEEALLKFVALLRAIYAGVTMSPLPIRCLS